MSQLTQHNDIFEYIKSQEIMYRNKIRLNDSWEWGMKDHIETSELYKNSQLKTGKNEWKPVKNITRPILNLQYRTEDIEVKDVQIYVNDPSKYHLSFLVKKYHDDVFVVENDIDTFFDELNVSRIDFGGGLSKQLNKPCPEVVPLQSIAFCDQTDILSGPIGLKHFFSPDQLLEMGDKGWGDTKNGATHTLEQVINLSREEKKDNKDGIVTKTPGRYIEVYEVHGNLPKKFSKKGETSEKYESQIFIVCFYTTENSEKKGVILYTAPEKKSPFKLVKRDPIYGRALGFGGAEELFEPQVWVNYDMIRMQDMLDSASKTILKTTDSTIAAKHPTGLKEMDNLEIVELAKETDLSQIDTFPRNFRLFENSIAMWESHGKDMGAAQDPIQGKEPSSGTPFASLQEQVRQGMGLHEFRRGQFAKHLEEIYKDWIIPHIQKKITEGTRFLSELTVDEMQYVADCLVRNEYRKYAVGLVLSGKNAPTPEEKEAFETQVRENFKRKGNKQFIEIIKGEFKNVPFGVKVSVAGKSKNLGAMTDKIVNIFRFIFSNPQGFAQVMQMPGMAKAFNQILEFSGMSPADFTGVDKMPQMQPEVASEVMPAEMPTRMAKPMAMQ